MNNEEMNQIIDEAYENYGQKIISEDLWMLVVIGWPSTQEEFINKCKTDQEFSEKWGLKIEERELSLEERTKILVSRSDNKKDFYDRNSKLVIEEKLVLDESNIPTKLITLTYNSETIESYE